ncbi:Fe-S cluster assembly protein SufB [Patescibacteria group bacterium]|nr:Fe-S cluster assembly protein SufB [Patescibacteria group bacterium]
MPVVDRDFVIKRGQWVDKIKPLEKIGLGLSDNIIRQISGFKQEPDWMLKRRLQAFRIFKQKKYPQWGPDLSKLNFNKICYYSRINYSSQSTWANIPSPVKKTFERLGVPKLEAAVLAGSGLQYDSEIVYQALQADLKKIGVIFLSMEQGLRQYPKLVKKYFGQVVPARDNKLAALNSAVWSGGSFIYVPPGLKVSKPLQAYFRLNARNLGQFERTLIIADKNSELEYIEGCTAPYFNVDSLHAAVVEIVVEAGAKVRYTTVQNWSTSVYNLVTKRALVKRNAYMEWLDGNFGSRVTMKYPSIILSQPGAKGKIVSLAVAGKGQVIETGAKAIHLAPLTSSQIISKSIALAKGRTNYRGLLKITPAANNSRSSVCCDALLLSPQARSDSYPKVDVKNQKVHLEHEASVARLSQEQLIYLQSRGFSKSEAVNLIVNGFVAPVRQALPAEFAIELEKLLDLEMEEAVG